MISIFSVGDTIIHYIAYDARVSYGMALFYKDKL